MGLFNLKDARNNRLQMVIRMLQSQGLGLGCITETKIPEKKPIHTRKYKGYEVYATYTTHINQGGVAFVYDPNAKNWCLESFVRHGPNVLSCVLVSGDQRTLLVGVYLPPNSLADLAYLEEALRRYPKYTTILMGDLNIDLSKTNHRAQEITNLLSIYGLLDLLPHFKQRAEDRAKNRVLHTYYQTRKNSSTKKEETVSSRCDYILSTDRRLFTNVAIREPRLFHSDHRLVVAKYLVRPPKCHRQYLNARRQMPFKMAKGPWTMADILFELVLRQVPAPEKRKPYTDKDWISDKSRQLWDQRCSLRRQKKHCKAEARRLTRAIAASLKADRKQRTLEVGEQIAASMNGGDQDEAYRVG